jgi:DnaJ-class molecular chaperone
VTLRARWVTLRARWVTLRARWVTLDVSRGADGAEVKRAFRLQCKTWHPDRAAARSHDDQRRATTQFKRVNEAYQVRGGMRWF